MHYHIITYGCQMNQSDSERVSGFLEAIGFTCFKKQSEADLMVVNICSVRQSAIDRAKAQIQNARKNKKCKIILTGCILNKDKRELNKYCDGIFSIDQLAQLPKMLKKLGFKIDTIKNQKIKHYLTIAPKYQSPLVAYVPIMTGCNNFCSYCVVPYVRGKEISRPAEEIVCEIKNIVKKGVKEVWLLGQNVNSYGINRGIPRNFARKDAEINFAKLLQMINDISGDFWIRFTSSHPKDFSDGLIETMAKCHKVAPYLNLPIQSGDDSILKAMNRSYSVKDYQKLIKKIRAGFKKYRQGLEQFIFLSTDAIVGFPKETKKQFQNTKKTFQEIGFSAGYVSRYSPRRQTAAFKLKDDIAPQEKKEREKELVKIIEKTALNFNKKFVNKIVNVLVLEKKKDYFIGKTRHFQTIKIKSKKDILGKFVLARTVKAAPYGLEGRVCPSLSLPSPSKGGGEIPAKDISAEVGSPQALLSAESYFPENFPEVGSPESCGGRVSGKLVVVLGPTASGKSDLAVEIALWLKSCPVLKKRGVKEKALKGAEIISADSRQVYKEMDLGTGKITKKEMQGIPHHLLDIASPKRKFSIVQFHKKAKKAIKEIHQKNKLPILCGGTGFYIQAVVDDLVIPKVKPDWKLRKKLEKETCEELYKKLKKLDPERAKNIDKKNKRRLIRALEIVLISKKPVPSLVKQKQYDVLIIGIKKDNQRLPFLIKKRLEKRMKAGMTKEVQQLKDSGVSWKRLEEFGLEYRWIAKYLQGKISKQEMTTRLQKDIENYAKRQMTWFKAYNPDTHWIKTKTEAQKLIKKFLKN